jgi:cytidylate kinase
MAFGSTVGAVSSRSKSMAAVLIAGAIASGKSAVSAALARATGGEVVRVREALADVLAIDGTDRETLQREGAELDRASNGRWLLEYLERRLELTSTLIVDSMRTRLQTVPVLERSSGAVLVYLDAAPETRRRRFEGARLKDPVKRSMRFAEAMRHPTELGVVELRPLAHLVLETDSLTVDEAVVEIIRALPEISASDLGG